MRTLIAILVFANLAFAAWALLIDRPVALPAAHDISHLPKLALAGEAALKAPLGSGTERSAGGNGRTAGASAAHCVTVGPFNDLAFAASAAALLHTRGFTPIQRTEAGPDMTAYWVYLDNVPTEAAAARLLQKLRLSGVEDAHTMPVASASEPRRVSVGLFNEHGGAERRARQVKGLGLTPVITEQHQPQASYWVDITVPSPGQSISTEGLLPRATAGAHLEIRECPALADSAPVPAGAPAK